MDKKDFTKQYAKRTGSTPVEAADQIDSVVNDLLRRLRAGQPASLPGFGPLLPATKGTKAKTKLKTKDASR
jgi:nucleoid DNA-binding protein